MTQLRILFGVVFCLVLASVSQAADPPKKNVLMIVSDDLNTDLGCFGHAVVKSPHIDRLAKRGVRFERAYCQYPLCNPSRSSFMTSLYPDQTGVLNNGGDFRAKNPDVVTLGQLFQKAGYFVARVGKIYHYGVPNQIGTDGADDKHSWQLVVNPRGLDRESHDKIHSLVPNEFGGTLSWLNIPSKDEEHTDGIGATEAIRLLEEHQPTKTGQPFFLAVGFYRPHTPYVAPSHYFDKYPLDAIHPVTEKKGDRDDIPAPALFDKPKQRELSIEQRKEIIQAYFASISLMDAQVGRLLDALERLKLADNTIVVFFSDHGYQLGEHDQWQKSTLFERSVRVPLIIANPGGENAGQVSSSLAELVDVYPTLADLCGLQTPAHIMGQSLVPVLHDTHQSLREAALSVTVSRSQSLGKRGTAAKGYSIRTNRHRYTAWNNGEDGEEIYDYEADPSEYTNLARDPQQRELLEKMRDLLKKQTSRATK
jgi:iduronate 2-sulfatase